MPNSKPRLIALIIAMSLLTACAHTETLTSCPPIPKYTAADEDALADELGTVSLNGPIQRWLSDYEVVRAQLRKCQVTPASR